MTVPQRKIGEADVSAIGFGVMSTPGCGDFNCKANILAFFRSGRRLW
jgi:hypothetical protein